MQSQDGVFTCPVQYGLKPIYKCSCHFIYKVLAVPLTVTPLEWWLIWPIQNDTKSLKSDRNPGIWVLIWEYSVTAIKWIPTWQGLDGFQKQSPRPCPLDESSLSIGRNKAIIAKTKSDQSCLLMFNWPPFFSSRHDDRLGRFSRGLG